MPDHQCQHLMGDGRRCGSPRMNTKSFCYYHTRLHESFLLPGNRYYQAPSLDDPHSVQLALNHVLLAHTRGLITARQANSFIYNIQMAVSNAAKMKTPPPNQVVTDYNECSADALVRADNAATGRCGTDAPASENEPQADIPYDEDHPPLCHALGLRPYGKPKPPASSIAVFERPTTDELRRMTVPHEGEIGTHKQRADLRRSKLAASLANIPEPTPTEIALAIAQIEEEEARIQKDRADEARRIAHDRKVRKQRELVGI